MPSSLMAGLLAGGRGLRDRSKIGFSFGTVHIDDGDVPKIPNDVPKIPNHEGRSDKAVHYQRDDDCVSQDSAHHALLKPKIFMNESSQDGATGAGSVAKSSHTLRNPPSL